MNTLVNASPRWYTGLIELGEPPHIGVLRKKYAAPIRFEHQTSGRRCRCPSSWATQNRYLTITDTVCDVLTDMMELILWSQYKLRIFTHAPFLQGMLLQKGPLLLLCMTTGWWDQTEAGYSGLKYTSNCRLRVPWSTCSGWFNFIWSPLRIWTCLAWMTSFTLYCIISVSDRWTSHN